ncbi:MAG TPA: hypothetical protein PK536_09500, partial [Ignavibacteria bacterium]|nr:hypothetical protein [Ignavibacteria bacterium]
MNSENTIIIYLDGFLFWNSNKNVFGFTTQVSGNFFVKIYSSNYKLREDKIFSCPANAPCLLRLHKQIDEPG